MNEIITHVKADFNICPNPVCDELKLFTDNVQLLGAISVKIYNNNGIMVYEGISVNANAIKVNSLASGYYTLIAVYNKQVITKNFIKQ
ncbi:MAG: T9SS type A sorting domain-containing protein [Bacteroidales bacterium]|nr:T9SS type A sorting domain-containing protein [Bacteroidales bacterium]